MLIPSLTINDETYDFKWQMVHEGKNMAVLVTLKDVPVMEFEVYDICHLTKCAIISLVHDKVSQHVDSNIQ